MRSQKDVGVTGPGGGGTVNDSANVTREIDGSGRAERDARSVRAVILDLDDTLFDHRTSALLGVGRLIRELGTAPTQALLDSWERTAEQLMNRRRAGEIDRDGYRHGRVRALLHDLGVLMPPPCLTARPSTSTTGSSLCTNRNGSPSTTPCRRCELSTSAGSRWRS